MATDYDDLYRRLAFVNDGQPIRDVGEWTFHKLALLEYYLPAFARLCQEGPGGWYYFDGFAGNGANRCPGLPLAKGSALIGVGQTPRPLKAVLIERDPGDAAALRARCAARSQFVTVIEDDCNVVIGDALNMLEDIRLPAFCALDPEGLELDWATVAACAAHRSRWNRYRYELLIYFSTPGTARSAGVRQDAYADMNERRLNSLFGNDSWKAIAERQQRHSLRPNEAGRLYLDLYKDQLRGLGYSTVLERPAIRSDGGLVYHLVFASANDAGRNIMSDALSRAYAGQLPFQL